MTDVISHCPDTSGDERERQQAYAAYEKAVEHSIKNVLLYGGVLAACVWLFPNWTISTRVAWSLVALAQAFDLLALPGKYVSLRALLGFTFDPGARRFQWGMAAVMVAENAALSAAIIWSAFRVWA